MKIYITRTEKLTTEVVLDSRYVNNFKNLIEIKNLAVELSLSQFAKNEFDRDTATATYKISKVTY